MSNSLCCLHRALRRVPFLSGLGFPICKMGTLRLVHYTMTKRSSNCKYPETDALDTLVQRPPAPRLLRTQFLLGSRGRTRGPDHTLALHRPSPNASPKEPWRPHPPPLDESSPSPCPHHSVGRDLARRSLPPPPPPQLTLPPAATPPRATRLNRMAATGASRHGALGKGNQCTWSRAGPARHYGQGGRCSRRRNKRKSRKVLR